MSASNDVSKYFKDTLRSETQIFLIPKISSSFCLPIINFSYTANSVTLILPLKPRELQSVSHLTARAASSFSNIITFQVTLSISSSSKIIQTLSIFIMMYRNLSFTSSTDSDVFYVEQSSPERCPIRHNTPIMLNSTQLSGAMDPETITISSVASPEPQIFTIESDSNEPTFPYAFGAQHPIIPPSLNDLNLPANPFNVLATMAVIHQDQEDSPQSPEPSDPSPISTPPMNISTIEGWETPRTTTDENTFYSSENEPGRVYWDSSPNETFESNEPRRVYPVGSPLSTPPPPPRRKRRLSIGMSFPKRGECSSTPARHAANPFHSTPEPTRNILNASQGTNEDDSQNDPHPEASLFQGQRAQNSGTERDYDSSQCAFFVDESSQSQALIFRGAEVVMLARCTESATKSILHNGATEFEEESNTPIGPQLLEVV